MPRASWRGFLRLSLVSCPVGASRDGNGRFHLDEPLGDELRPIIRAFLCRRGDPAQARAPAETSRFIISSFSIISAVLPIVDRSSIARLPDRILRGRGSGGAQFTSEEFSTGRRRCTIRRGQGPFL